MLPKDILLVDDVVTKGTTLIACAAILSEAFPHATIRAFAMVRTMGRIPDVEAIVDPCTGVISFDGYDVDRVP
ncbi:hypothetical protein Hsar01_03243 [Haloferula sargassicola]|uniref:Phosphoribosyltransferase domain-containing protein n=2 Tax=Haloferula sargassicola TaxID=490096 RepID=A0ABP9UR34_9BACT